MNQQIQQSKNNKPKLRHKLSRFAASPYLATGLLAFTIQQSLPKITSLSANSRALTTKHPIGQSKNKLTNSEFDKKCQILNKDESEFSKTFLTNYSVDGQSKFTTEYPAYSSGLANFSAKKTAQTNVFVKTWSKNELKKKPKEPEESLISVFAKKFGQFVASVGKKDAPESHKKGLKKLYQNNKEISRELYFHKLSHLEKVPVRKEADTYGLAIHLRTQASQVLSSLVNNSLPILNKIKQGLNFNLGLSTKDSNGNRKPVQKYGLILKKIKPAKDPVNQASTSSMEEDLEYASKGDVVWTIGPVTAEKKPSIQKVNYGEFSQIKEKSTWDKVSVPDVNFKVKIVPASKNIEHYVNKDHPGFVVSMTQVENIYKITYITKDAKKTTHTVKIPLLRNLNAMRIYDSEGNPKETSLNNLLVVNGLPALNLKYVDPEEFYNLTASHSFGDHNVNMGVQRRFINIGKDKPETKITSGYSIKF